MKYYISVKKLLPAFYEAHGLLATTATQFKELEAAGLGTESYGAKGDKVNSPFKVVELPSIASTMPLDDSMEAAFQESLFELLSPLLDEYNKLPEAASETLVSVLNNLVGAGVVPAADYAELEFKLATALNDAAYYPQAIEKLGAALEAAKQSYDNQEIALGAARSELEDVTREKDELVRLLAAAKITAEEYKRSMAELRRDNAQTRDAWLQLKMELKKRRWWQFWK